MFRGAARAAIGAKGYWGPHYFLCIDLRNAGAGDCSRGWGSRQQGIRFRTCGHRDGATFTEAERKSTANGACREKASARLVSLRTKSREFAMQMLFQWDMSRQDPAKLEAKFWRTAKEADNTRAFANKLFEGAAKNADELDALIVQHAQNWRLERMAIIDRAVLRLAIYELRIAETPPKVVLNEAVDLAKKFSSEDAGAFVNGILDAVNKTLAEKSGSAK